MDSIELADKNMTRWKNALNIFSTRMVNNKFIVMLPILLFTRSFFNCSRSRYFRTLFFTLQSFLSLLLSPQIVANITWPDLIFISISLLLFSLSHT